MVLIFYTIAATSVVVLYTCEVEYIVVLPGLCFIFLIVTVLTEVISVFRSNAKSVHRAKESAIF